MSSSGASRALNSAADAGGGHKAVSITSEIPVAAIVFFFVALVVFFLHIYTKMRWCRGAPNAFGAARSAHFALGDAPDPSASPPKGLDPDVIRTLPFGVFRQGDFKEGSECVVCLSEFADGEKARLLPKCNHGFHLDCIDVWFRSHSTCPLCRSPVGPQAVSDSCAAGAPPPPSVEAVSTESPNLPTNVLFWGTQDQVSTGGGSPPLAVDGMQYSPSSSSSPPASRDPKGVLVINIPRAAEDLSSLDEVKSPTGAATATPTSTRLRSFRRLLSWGGRASGGDIEQGGVEVLADGPGLGL